MPDVPLADIAEALGLRDVDPVSLTRFARVHRARTADGRPVVVKRTARRADRARAMASWTRAAAHAGLPVVSPVDLDRPNPQPVGENWWVAYPWVEGAAYQGDVEQVRMAGDLLGRLHTLPVDAPGLRRYEWPDGDPDAVVADLVTLAGVLAVHGADDSVDTVRRLAGRWRTRALPTLAAADAALPRTAVSSDHKAVNLVFTAAGPVLVDPDNGGLEPRLLDLALAVVLFHNECPGAPGRLFCDQEWAWFIDAYLQHVTLTPVERTLWPAALDHMLWEEGTWALQDNDVEAWADPRQAAFLRDLARTTPDRYPLPG